MNEDPRFRREDFEPEPGPSGWRDDAPPHGEAGASRPAKFKLVRWGETPFDPNEEWRVKHILPKHGVGLLYGNSQGFKSFVAMHLALSVALGEAWGGKRVEKAAVVYLCAEGQKGFPKRERALTEKWKIKGKAVDFHIVYTAPNLGVMDGDLSDLVAAIEASGVHPGLVVIDTAAKVIGGADENGAGMAALLWNAGALAQHFGCFVLAVHHVGHGEDAKKRPRGWSGAIGNPDALILCDRIGETFSTSLTVQKEKDEASGFALTAHLSRVVLGTDRDGDEISTLVVDEVVKAGAVAKVEPPKKPPTQQRLLMEIVHAAIDEAGEVFRPWPSAPEVRAVADEHIRSRLYAAIAEQVAPDEDADKLEKRQNRAFNRAIERALNAKALIAKSKGVKRYVWLPHNT